ncbi:hypothetical protein CHCC14809_2219 [Bacillus licheniformis]|nr:MULTISPECIES: hypothetical protein [Bacillus subtilis group]KND06208.1 hypothetical protein ACJ43_17715 [Bacillus paralicheniformis]MCY9239071.1 hypothetical protein [Bacillus licheniformis]OJT64962.1 hypothetical protein BFP49_06770 [Bacillus licheniformis]TWM72060.1 hypothetical protein CHCC14809_2219 [Bacillus licheniformis]TWN93177.1 hypothetical protein CHCC20491_1828 [Bacillus paralicheniformis]
MENKQFYTYKFNSSRLKEFGYNISLSFEEAQEYNEVIALFDNQILRSIRDIKNKEVDYTYLESLNKEKETLQRLNHSQDISKKLKGIQNEINEILFIPEYITIKMDHPSHYKDLHKNGLTLNNKKFIRFSSSAGQARVSTVVFIEEETSKRLNEILDNGRDLKKALVPSKFNAYKGLAGSATQVVSAPRFCLVPDYYSDTKVKVNFVTETNYEDDDIIEVKDIVESFNRFDGQGLISYEMAKKWADELGLDYVPAQWCIRQNFIKGMLNTFPIHEFCEKVNNGNYRIRTSYKDSDGNPKIVDLRDIDVILTESQFKLWDSFPSIEVYENNCEKNNLKWGVSLHSPKKDKDILKMNYQFLQTLNLNHEDIEKVCEKFVNWITGVNSGNIYYTILFLLGTDVTDEKITNYMEKSDNHWVKSLIVNPDLINDKYIKKKIYDLMKRKIQRGCLGDIILDGNFQTLVSDPYAMMQHVCGLEVTGLLGKREYYSNYWNQKGIKYVDSMRAPLTYRSEHLILNLKQTEDMDYWYRHNYTGIIVNIHGSETMNWAGSDFDYDIIATTSDKTVLKGVYKNELPVAYTPPTSTKKVLTEEDLFNADLFSFGSIIGSITNKSTSGYALLSQLDSDSEEYLTTLNRVKMCTKLQSAQIDKAKIGREVKGIPSRWINYQKIKKDDTENVKTAKEFYNRILLDKHPYFFIYLYKGTKNKYKKHVKTYDITCKQKFGASLQELKKVKRKTKEQHEFLKLFERFNPVIESDCVMNRLCKYIESVDFGIRNIVNKDVDDEVYQFYMNDTVEFDESRYRNVAKVYQKHKKSINQSFSLGTNSSGDKNLYDSDLCSNFSNSLELFKQRINDICSNIYEAVNYLVRLFYVDEKSSNKEILWHLYGKYIFENVKAKRKSFNIPVLDQEGDINYLNKHYSLRKVCL